MQGCMLSASDFRAAEGQRVAGSRVVHGRERPVDRSATAESDLLPHLVNVLVRVNEIDLPRVIGLERDLILVVNLTAQQSDYVGVVHQREEGGVVR